VDTLCFPGVAVEANWENESDRDLGRIRVYCGALGGYDLVGVPDKGPDYLGGIPFRKMDALEAVAISDVREYCEGSFSSLLLRPSLKLLQMEVFSYSPIRARFTDRIAKDLGGRPANQVETLVLSSGTFLWSLDKLLALFPNLKSLRISVQEEKPFRHLNLALGSMIRGKLEHLSELVVEEDSNNAFSIMSRFGGNVEFFLRGLGSEWSLAPVAPGVPKRTLRFVAAGRDRAEFSCYMFQDKFFNWRERCY
jgi:hypothetical protein